MIDLGIKEYNYIKYKVMVKNKNKTQEEFSCLGLAAACSRNQVLKAPMSMIDSTVIQSAVTNLKLAGKEKQQV